VEKWRGRGRHSPYFSLVYATPLLQHQAQFGLNQALQAISFVSYRSLSKGAVRWRYRAGKVTVGLALHWSCVSDFTGSRPKEGKGGMVSIPLAVPVF